MSIAKPKRLKNDTMSYMGSRTKRKTKRIVRGVLTTANRNH